jgi:hypothetical protein
MTGQTFSMSDVPNFLCQRDPACIRASGGLAVAAVGLALAELLRDFLLFTGKVENQESSQNE